MNSFLYFVPKLTVILDFDYLNVRKLFFEPIGAFSANDDGGRLNFCNHGIDASDKEPMRFLIASETVCSKFVVSL